MRRTALRILPLADLTDGVLDGTMFGMPPRPKREPSIEGLTDESLDALIDLFTKLLAEYVTERERRARARAAVEYEVICTRKDVAG